MKGSEHMSTINEYLAQWRVQHGLTQKQIGDKVGADYTQVSAFERGYSMSGRVMAGYMLSGLIDFGEEVVTYGKEEKANGKTEA